MCGQPLVDPGAQPFASGSPTPRRQPDARLQRVQARDQGSNFGLTAAGGAGGISHKGTANERDTNRDSDPHSNSRLRAHDCTSKSRCMRSGDRRT